MKKDILWHISRIGLIALALAQIFFVIQRHNQIVQLRKALEHKEK